MNKKIYAAFSVILTVIIIGCIKNDNPTACQPTPATSDTAQMKKFIRDSSLTADSNTSNWLMWQIIKPGTGAVPTPSSILTVKYMGRLLTGQGFDSTYQKYPDGFKFSVPLSQLIPGWQQGLPKIKEGGQIKLIIPSSLAYGCDPRYGTLTNQSLYFNVELIKVDN